MRFNVGDIFKAPAPSPFIYKVKQIRGNEYKLDFKNGRDGPYVDLGGWWGDEHFEGYELVEPAVQREELTFYCVLYKVNNDQPVEMVSFDNQHAAESWKRTAENVGYITVGLKKIKVKV